MADDDFGPLNASGYKAGERRTINEYQNLDAHDESLNNWKASLGLGQVSGPLNDPRRVVILAIVLEVAGRPDVVLDLSTPEALEASKAHPFVIKEGVEYRMRVHFKIQHDVISGLRYLQVVKKLGIKVDKTEEMIGSYGPSPEPYVKKFMLEEAPSGMLARGKYEAKSRFVDDDGHAHAEFSWNFEIKRDWSS